MADDSEAWKGESGESGDSMYGMWSMFKPPTAEEKEQALRAVAERIAQGNALFDMLQRFDPSRVCPKCGETKAARVSYCSGGAASYHPQCQKAAGEHEHLHVECRRCKYVRYEKPLDAES